MDKPFEIYKMGHFKIVTELVSPMSMCSNFTNRILNKIKPNYKNIHIKKKICKNDNDFICREENKDMF